MATLARRVLVRPLMGRRTRFAEDGLAFHITSGTGNGLPLFRKDGDRLLFLQMLSQACRQEGMMPLAWVLMTTHFHLVAWIERARALPEVMRRTKGEYAKAYNRAYRHEGPLFRGRYWSCAMDERHTIAAIRYVLQNPVRATMVELPQEYEWSCAAYLLGNSPSDRVLETRTPFGWEFDWAQFLASAVVETDCEVIRSHSRRGTPLGDDSFVKMALEKEIPLAERPERKSPPAPAEAAPPPTPGPAQAPAPAPAQAPARLSSAGELPPAERAPVPSFPGWLKRLAGLVPLVPATSPATVRQSLALWDQRRRKAAPKRAPEVTPSATPRPSPSAAPEPPGASERTTRDWGADNPERPPP